MAIEVSVCVGVTENYCKAFDIEKLLDESPDTEPELAQELRASGAAECAARLHRLQLDHPEHPLVQSMWAQMKSRGEVTGETWEFSVR
ncbi:hypothetical protein MUG78_16820 [Gordonia alkaliphila]|uniref:hypothetical protein n=1 Tax=Gordonia alkaliphila TaxID=1053547 RepID=UPI001FF14F77|nr:hypothetical protein [Gordonia alkaliphila]MCK0441064.1 hypothetical protein [Gordonia alkaliphila]